MSQPGASSTGETGSPRNAVALRASNDAWHRRDHDAALAPYADEIKFDTTQAYPDGHV
jgi:hypothetical protein